MRNTAMRISRSFLQWRWPPAGPRVNHCPHGFPLDITQKEVQKMLFQEAGVP
jgi:hypothetical protein